MTGTEARSPELERLDAFVGEWTMENPFAEGLHAKCVFEWLQGEQFLIQRWEVDHPDAPDGIAIIGFDADKGGYAQHYFDSRGVARVYEMSFEDGVWKLWRDSAPGLLTALRRHLQRRRQHDSKASGRSRPTTRPGSRTSSSTIAAL